MAASAAAWESKRWALLASIIVLAALWGSLWWLLGGCEETPRKAGDVPGRPDPTIAALQAMKDPGVLEFSLQVAWFHARQGRLPADIEELRRGVNVAGWPPAPTASSRGQAFAYRPTGPRTYELALPGKDAVHGTPDDLPLAMDVPTDLPTDLQPDALRAWWELHILNRMTEQLRKALQDLAPAPGNAPSNAPAKAGG